MTIKLDLRTRSQPGSTWRPPTLLAALPYGCADCGQWFQFAPQLVAHLCEQRGHE